MRNDNGTFAKGNKGKPKGAQTKTTKEIREYFKILLSNNLEKLESDIQELEPKERIKIILELSKFVIPTIKSQQIDDANAPTWGEL